MSSSILAALRRFFAHERGRGVVAAYLFGSHAAGVPHRESDVDVGVLLDRRELPTPKARFEARLRLITRLRGSLATEVDVVVLNEAPPTLGRKIVTEGIPLLGTDPEVEHGFRRDVQLRAADLDLFLRRMRRIKLEALSR